MCVSIFKITKYTIAYVCIYMYLLNITKYNIDYVCIYLATNRNKRKRCIDLHQQSSLFSPINADKYYIIGLYNINNNMHYIHYAFMQPCIVGIGTEGGRKNITASSKKEGIEQLDYKERMMEKCNLGTVLPYFNYVKFGHILHWNN